MLEIFDFSFYILKAPKSPFCCHHVLPIEVTRCHFLPKIFRPQHDSPKIGAFSKINSRNLLLKYVQIHVRKEDYESIAMAKEFEYLEAFLCYSFKSKSPLF